MGKNTHIHIKVSSPEIKNALEEKAKDYGSMSNFLEHLAKHDIIILDSNASKTLRTWMKGESLNIVKGGKRKWEK